MTILVKNEADIIEKNIVTHAKLGVDAFVVMDNNSQDGTRELLSKLSDSYDIRLFDEKGLYNQAVWMKRLAKEAKKIGADWVINNDADEFWIPKNGLNLHDVFAYKGTVAHVQRYNMLMDPAASQKGFAASVHRVVNPVAYSKNIQLLSDNVSMVLTKIGPKTALNPRGLITIRGGNHKAWHIMNSREYLFMKADDITKKPDINVYHYPFRSYTQFENNIINRKSLMESGKHIRMGPHYRRWVKLYNAGKLPEEYNRLCFDHEQLDILKKYSIVTEDQYPASILE